MRFSMNANAQQIGDESRFLAFMSLLKPTSAGLMDGLKLSEKTYDRIGGGIVWHRSFPESEAQKAVSAASLVQRHKSEGARHIYRYILNEQAPDSNTLNWLIDYADRARDAGIHAVLGNFAVGSYEIEAIEKGHFDKYLKCLARHDGWHIGGWHEYASVALPLGVAGTDYNDLFLPGLLQEHVWASSAKVNVLWRKNYHLGRSMAFSQREATLGLKPHKKLITECFFDDLPDIGPILRRFEQHIGQTIKCSGIQTLRKAWKYLWPDWTFEEAFVEQWRWADGVYPDDYLGFNHFTWSRNPRWKDYDISQEYALHEALIQYAQEHRMPTLPSPNPIGHVLDRDLTTSSRLRKLPDEVVGEIIMQVPIDARVHVYPDSAFIGKNYNWYTVQHANQIGWMALVAADFDSQFRPIEAPPEISSTIEVTLKGIGVEDADRLKMASELVLDIVSKASKIEIKVK